MDIQEKLDRLRKTVLEDASTLRDQRLEELKIEKSRYLRAMKEEVTASTKEYIKREEAELDRRNKKERAAAELEKMHKLSEKRRELQDRVLEEVREEVKRFVKEPGYAAWLEERLRAVDPVYLQDPLSALCGENAPAEEAVLRRVFPGIAIERDHTVVLGGVRLHDPVRQVIIDLTLDQKFEEARAAFYSQRTL